MMNFNPTIQRINTFLKLKPWLRPCHWFPDYIIGVSFQRRDDVNIVKTFPFVWPISWFAVQSTFSAGKWNLLQFPTLRYPTPLFFTLVTSFSCAFSSWEFIFPYTYLFQFYRASAFTKKVELGPSLVLVYKYVGMWMSGNSGSVVAT